MSQSRPMDAFGAISLILFAALMGFNQVVIKVVNEGLQPVFFAGLRSVGAVICLALYMRVRGLSLAIAPGTWRAGLLIGLFFAIEFIFMFLALDYTSVTRSSVILYSMPVWLAMAAHFVLDDPITPRKGLGLVLAFAGVAFAIVLRGDAQEGALIGDLFALGAAMSWAAIALCARGTAMNRVRPEMQLLWQVAVSAPILLVVALFFGPFLRDPAPIHWAGLGFQIVVVVSFGFTAWLWLLGRYASASVASFSFLSPLFGAFFGSVLLGETLSPGLAVALVMVSGGLLLINWPGALRFRRRSA